MNDLQRKALEKTPIPVKMDRMQVNVHPNEAGQWVWHASTPGAENEGVLEEFLSGVGEGDVFYYEGGSYMKVAHAQKRLTQDEIEQLPEEAHDWLKDIQRQQKQHKAN